MRWKVYTFNIIYCFQDKPKCSIWCSKLWYCISQFEEEENDVSVIQMMIHESTIQDTNGEVLSFNHWLCILYQLGTHWQSGSTMSQMHLWNQLIY